MKKTLAVLIFGFVVVSLVNGYSIELESKINSESITPRINLFATSSVTEKTSIFAFSLTSEGYCEAYAGVSYDIKPYLQMGAGLGLETVDEPWRITASLWIGTPETEAEESATEGTAAQDDDRGKSSLVVIYENGGSGYWYKAVASYAINNWLTTGIYTKRFLGIGPLVKIPIPNMPVSISLVPAYDFEFKNSNLMAVIAISL